MVADINDYRVSRIVILCKDCGEDVGLYPSRHKCKPAAPPPLPLSTKYKNAKSGGPGDVNGATGSKWGKLRQVDNWKEVGEGKEAQISPERVTAAQATPGGSLWDRLLAATYGVQKAVASYTDDGYASDHTDHDGETHISRVLREYYARQYVDRALPKWLVDSKTPKSALERKKEPTEAIDPRREAKKQTTNSRSRSAEPDVEEEPERPKFSLRDMYDSAQTKRSSPAKSQSTSAYGDDPPPVSARSRIGERLLADKKRAMEERKGRSGSDREQRLEREREEREVAEEEDRQRYYQSAGGKSGRSVGRRGTERQSVNRDAALRALEGGASSDSRKSDRWDTMSERGDRYGGSSSRRPPSPSSRSDYGTRDRDRDRRDRDRRPSPEDSRARRPPAGGGLPLRPGGGLPAGPRRREY